VASDCQRVNRRNRTRVNDSPLQRNTYGMWLLFGWFPEKSVCTPPLSNLLDLTSVSGAPSSCFLLRHCSAYSPLDHARANSGLTVTNGRTNALKGPSCIAGNQRMTILAITCRASYRNSNASQATRAFHILDLTGKRPQDPRPVGLQVPIQSSMNANSSEDFLDLSSRWLRFL